MRDKKHDAESKSSNREDRKMSTAYIDTAKGMAGFVLEREYRGPGDTIEAAAYRAQHKYGVAATLLMRLRHREVRDMLMSNFMELARAYQSASQKLDGAYEREKSMAIDPKIVRLANFVAGEKNQTEE